MMRCILHTLNGYPDCGAIAKRTGMYDLKMDVPGTSGIAISLRVLYQFRTGHVDVQV